MATKQTPMQPSKAEIRSQSTTTIAKTIIAAETSARETKVKRLRAAREERDASAPPEKMPKTRRKPSTAKRETP